MKKRQLTGYARPEPIGQVSTDDVDAVDGGTPLSIHHQHHPRQRHRTHEAGPRGHARRPSGC